jgi:membrane protease subunit (stomatin/prohibitin family)
MGLIRASVGAVGGTLADQWKDFLTVPEGIAPTAALFPAVPTGNRPRRESNRLGSTAVVTNGSRIVVPEGYGLLLLEDGRATAFVNEAGGYIWETDNQYSQSIFAGDAWSTSLVRQSWERFKFGGRPGTEQYALFINLKEIANNKFGTQSPIYWDDKYLGAQVGAITHGSYSLRILDPILFALQFVPASYLQAQEVFDFSDRENPASSQLFSEIVASLAAAFSGYTNDVERGNRIWSIQQDVVGFSSALAESVEASFSWRGDRGLEITKVALVGVDYDEDTRELLKSVQRADALTGSRGNSNLQASVAAGFEAAGETEGAGGILGLGIAGGSVGLPSMMQPSDTAPRETPPEGAQTNLVETLSQLKVALDQGLISQEDYDAAKSKALGLD